MRDIRRGVSGAAAVAQEHRHSVRVFRGQEREDKALNREEDGMAVIDGKFVFNEGNELQYLNGLGLLRSALQRRRPHSDSIFSFFPSASPSHEFSQISGESQWISKHPSESKGPLKIHGRISESTPISSGFHCMF